MHGDFIYFIHISAQIYSIRAGMYDLLENSRQCLCSFLTSADVPVYHTIYMYLWLLRNMIDYIKCCVHIPYVLSSLMYCFFMKSAYIKKHSNDL